MTPSDRPARPVAIVRFTASRRALLTAAGAALTATACGKPPAAPVTAFDGFVNDFTRAVILDSPELATEAGFTREQAGYAFETALDDRSPQAADLRRAAALRRRAEFKAIDPKALTAAQRLTHALLDGHLRRQAVAAAFEYGDLAPLGGVRPYAVNPLDSAFLSLPDFFDAAMPVRTLAEGELYLARMRRVAGAIDQESERARRDAAKGVVAPDFLIERTLALLAPLAGAAPETSPFVTSLNRRLAALAGALTPVEPIPATRAAPPPPESPTQAQAKAQIAQAIAIARDAILPAYRRQLAVLAELRPRARTEAGVRGLPQGEGYYAAALALETTTSLTPEAIFELGKARMGELNAQIDIQLRTLGATQGPVGERLAALTTAPANLYANDEAGRAQLLGDLAAILARAEKAAPNWFAARPKAKIEIRPVPAFAEASQPGAYYQPPALDGSRPGVFSINLRDTAEQPRFDLATLVHHEAVPGHHFQIALAQEQTQLPLLRRLMAFSAFNEGWALYAETLADEMGLFEQDPMGRLGFLRWQMWRAARLVVDTGLHAFGWTKAQAVAFLREATGDALGTIETEVERYCAWPGQACAYEIGRMEITRLREEARAKLGAGFDIRAFHDATLLNGDVPLDVLAGIITGWTGARAVKPKR